MTTTNSTNLKNYGTVRLHDQPCDDEATIIATGLGRSGTTMIARVLSSLGLFIGDHLTPRSSEDTEMQSALKSYDINGLSAIFSKRNERFPKWGFKVPAARARLPWLSKNARNPRIIITFRDVISIAVRRNVEKGDAILDDIVQISSATSKILSTLKEIPCPILLISYEKALQYPNELTGEIADFCGLDFRSNAAEIIRNGDPAYLGVKPPLGPVDKVSQPQTHSGQN